MFGMQHLILPRFSPYFYQGEYFGQPIVYNGYNFILTLAKVGKPGETYLIINNGFTIKDPFSSAVKDNYPNAWIFGFYYRISDPEVSFPKRYRIKRLLKKHPEFFGCKGLYHTQMEFMRLIEEQMAFEEIILVGFTKSANMFLNHAEYPPNVVVDAICPMFEGTFATRIDILKKYLKAVYHLVRWIPSEHIVDEDIAVGSEYLKNADYSGLKKEQVVIVLSSFDKRIPHTWKEVLHPANVFFRLVSFITDRVITKYQADETGYKSNGFISYHSQLPPFKVSKVIKVWGSMPMTLNHPRVKELINQQIKEKNEKSSKKRNVFFDFLKKSPQNV